MKEWKYEKSVPVIGSYDVVVAGAGPAGICTAVAAARSGVNVALVERYGVLGGNLTAGYVGPILGMVGKGTMRDEVMDLLGVPDNDMIGETGVAHDMEKAKRVLAEFVARENIDVFLQTPIVDGILEDMSLKGLVVMTKEGMRIIEGKVTVDATGDGDVAHFAGAPVEKGREDGLMQPVTLEFTLEGVDESRAITCIGDVDDVKLNGERFLDYCARCARQGLLPKNLAAVRLHPTVRPGQRQVNTTQYNGADATRVQDLFAAEVELRRQIEILVKFFRENLPGYEKCWCMASGDTLGVRETRRVQGEYVITAKELAAAISGSATSMIRRALAASVTTSLSELKMESTPGAKMKRMMLKTAVMPTAMAPPRLPYPSASFWLPAPTDWPTRATAA